jgi:YlmC/YmxH family sporulation protein
MIVSLSELKGKEVISSSDGSRLGFIDDIEVDTVTGTLASVVIYGRSRFFGLAEREDDFVIPYKNVALIGRDTILVNHNPALSGNMEKIDLKKSANIMFY